MPKRSAERDWTSPVALERVRRASSTSASVLEVRRVCRQCWPWRETPWATQGFPLLMSRDFPRRGFREVGGLVCERRGGGC